MTKVQQKRQHKINLIILKAFDRNRTHIPDGSASPIRIIEQLRRMDATCQWV